MVVFALEVGRWTRDPGFRHPIGQGQSSRRDTVDAATRGAVVAPSVGFHLACVAARTVASFMLELPRARGSDDTPWSVSVGSPVWPSELDVSVV